ncbi:MAG: hypothetical protein R2699_14215 [Acidimicrobiales bacterium]
MATYLDAILTAHRAAAAADTRPLDELIVEAEAAGPARGFADRLRSDAATGLAVIAEVKRRSPSRETSPSTSTRRRSQPPTPPAAPAASPC